MTAGQHTSSSEQKNTGRIILVVVLIVGVATAVGLGVWYWQQQEINRLNDQVAELQQEQSEQVGSLNDRVRQLENELADTKDKLAQAEAGQQTASNQYTSIKGVTIQVDSPKKDSQVTSPLTITGMVPGSWSFEADFPVQLKDGGGNVVAQATAKLQGDWMTEDLVPFEATLTFTSPGGGAGTLVLQKDNPSGMPEHDDSVSIPVNF
jgi:type II secretory pathway pseudopilin PulG